MRGVTGESERERALARSLHAKRISRPARAAVSALLAGLALACMSLTAVATLQGQGAAPRESQPARPHLLTAREGRAIVNVAWQQELPARGARDCSHIVHEIYASAGFDYPYASSFEIYAGNATFARVKYPRPGDVIAWPGHMGIVVDPIEHSFYSLVRTGLEEQNYESAYWRSRGRPRFFRFRVENGAVLSASVTNSSADPIRQKPFIGPRREDLGTANDAFSDRPPNATPRVSTAKSSGPSRESRSQSRSADVTGDDERVSAASRSANRLASADAGRSSGVYGPPAPEPETDSSAENENENENKEAAPFEAPKSVIVATSGKAPTREEVAQGISELSDALGSALRGENAFKTPQPVVIVEQFRVEKVEVKRDHGSARLAVDSRVMISSGAVQLKRRHEKVRWELQRTESGWEALPPADRTYVPHDVAVKNLAAQLARLAASDGAAQHDEAVLRQEAQISGLLSALLEKK